LKELIRMVQTGGLYDEDILAFLPSIYNDQDHRSICHYDWLDQLVGGEHASQMGEAPLFNLLYSQLLQAGVWETGQGSRATKAEVERTTEDKVERATEFVFESSSKSQTMSKRTMMLCH
jgi:hypothetical protein